MSANLPFTESNATPADAFALRYTLHFTDSNATPTDAFTLGSLAQFSAVQIWGVKVFGTTSEGGFVPRDNGGILP